MLLCVGLIDGQMVGVGGGGGGGGEGGMPHFVNLHSDELCSADMPRALNKPVAEPRVEPFNTESGRWEGEKENEVREEISPGNT